MDAVVSVLQPLNELRLRYHEAYVDWSVAKEGIAFVDRYFWVLAAVAAAYLPLTFGLQRWMKTREPYNLRGPLVVWNMVLVAFNVYAFTYMVPGIYRSVVDGKVPEIFCSVVPEHTKGVGNHAIYLFALSKVPEMIDTLFIVLKKKELIVLHWFHHITVMLFCWSILYSAAYENEGFDGHCFGTINAFVHILMYFSYGLKAMGYKPPGDLFITTLQLSQMVIGSWIAGYRLAYCSPARPSMVYASVVMYISYFALFAHFFYTRYLTSRPDRKPQQQQPHLNGKVTTNGDHAKSNGSSEHKKKAQ